MLLFLHMLQSFSATSEVQLTRLLVKVEFLSFLHAYFSLSTITISININMIKFSMVSQLQNAKDGFCNFQV